MSSAFIKLHSQGVESLLILLIFIFFGTELPLLFTFEGESVGLAQPISQINLFASRAAKWHRI